MKFLARHFSTKKLSKLSLISEGGMIFGHDGHLPDVAQLIYDPEFWRHEFGESVPKITKVFGQPCFMKIEKI